MWLHSRPAPQGNCQNSTWGGILRSLAKTAPGGGSGAGFGPSDIEDPEEARKRRALRARILRLLEDYEIEPRFRTARAS